MPRRSPRSRRKSSETPRTPAARRARARPGRKRTVARVAKARGAHALKGARPAPKAASRRGVTRAGTTARNKTPGRARAARFTPPDPARVAALLAALDATYPDARCELDFATPLQLLIATILSAQCTDKRVNVVTPALFARYPDAAAFAAAPQEALEEMVRSTGFYRMKARAIRDACADIVARFGGDVPRTLEELTTLRGVGRKTANVVLGNAYGIPGLVVDTHVTRLSHRLDLTRESDAVKIEFALMDVIPRERWTIFSHWLILHGRRVCNARKPFCSRCPLAPNCPRRGVTVSQ